MRKRLLTAAERPYAEPRDRERPEQNCRRRRHSRGPHYAPPPAEIRVARSPGHHRNFLDTVKSRQDPMAPVEVGHHTATICHLINISLQLDGRKLKWDPKKEQIIDDPQANSMIKRPMRTPWRL